MEQLFKQDIDYILDKKYSKIDYTGICAACNKPLKNSYICIKDNLEIVYGKNCLFKNKNIIDSIDKEFENVEFYLRNFTNNFKYKINDITEGHNKYEGKLLITKENGIEIPYHPPKYLKLYVLDILKSHNCLNF